MSSDDITSETTAQGAESESEEGKGEAVVGGGKPSQRQKRSGGKEGKEEQREPERRSCLSGPRRR